MKRGISAFKVDFEGNPYISEYDLARGDLPPNIDGPVDEEAVYTDNLLTREDTYTVKFKVQGFAKHYGDRFESIPAEVPRSRINQENVEGYGREFANGIKTLYVRSHMGTAKTKELMNYLLEYIPKNPTARIYILTFRITFGRDL